MNKPSRAVLRACHAIGEARRICAEYARGSRPTTTQRLRRLQDGVGLTVSVRPLDVPSILLPAVFGGRYRLIVDESVHRGTRDGYLIRHELGHILAGDAEELTAFVAEYPLPEAEMVADLFAFADLLPAGHDDVAPLIGGSVVFEQEAWYLRAQRIARELEALDALLHRGTLGRRGIPPRFSAGRLGRRRTRHAKQADDL